MIMRLIVSALSLLLAITVQAVPPTGTVYTVMTDSHGVVTSPTNFWRANYMGIKPEIAHPDGVTLMVTGTTLGWTQGMLDLVMQDHFAILAAGLGNAYDAVPGGAWWFTSSTEIDPLSTNYFWNAGFCNFQNAGATGLVAHYLANDSAGDTTVLDTTGMYTGTAQQNTSAMATSGKINGALYFNGYSDYVEVPNVMSGCDVDNSSISVWVKRDRTDAYDVIIGSPYVWSEHPVSMYIMADNTIEFGGVRYWSWDSTGTISDTSWHHIVGTVSGNQCALYIDGTLDSTFEKPNTAPNDASHYWIGAQYPLCNSQCPPSGDMWYFQGVIDDVRFYCHSLSAGEVADIYNAGNGTEIEGGSASGPTNMTLVTRQRQVVAGTASNVVSSWDIVTTNAPSTNWIAVDVTANQGTNWTAAAWTAQAGTSNAWWITATTNGVSSSDPASLQARLRIVGTNPSEVKVRGAVVLGGTPQ